MGQQPAPLSRSQIISYIAIFSAVLAILSFIRIPMPFPLSSVSLFTLGIYSVGVLLGPSIGFISGGIGGATASLIHGEPGLWVASAFIAKAAAGATIGLLRILPRYVPVKSERTKRGVGESIALITGRTVELTIFFAIDAFLYGVPAALVDYLGMSTLVFAIPVGLLVNEGVRATLRRNYLDRTAL